MLTTNNIDVIDLFAGFGGSTTGAKMAGCNVVWAANHWQSAVDYHKINHPGVIHCCQDLHQANWSDVPAHDLGLASPSCQGHARARGKDRPHHDASRSTAWAVVSAAEYHRTPVWVVENVPEFLNWNLYPAWKLAMESMGYSLSPYIVDAADHGVPQHRVRLFLICTQSKNPITLSLPKQKYKPISNVIQWDEHRWSDINKPGRSKNTLSRVARGRESFGDRFVMPYYGSGSGLTGRDINRPLGTVTTRDRWAVVDGNKMRMLQPEECRGAMGFPAGYKLPKDKKLSVHLLGNAVCPPVARDIINAIKEAA